MTGTFEGVGSLQFTPDNKFAYAYSGVVDVNNSDVTILEFTNNSEYIDSKIDIVNGSGSGDDMRYYIKYNDVIIVQIYSGTSDVLNQFSFPKYLVIPPFTKVTIIGVNISSGTLRAHTVTMVGKVKGAIEQENLEAITNNNKWASK